MFYGFMVPFDLMVVGLLITFWWLALICLGLLIVFVWFWFAYYFCLLGGVCFV